MNHVLTAAMWKRIGDGDLPQINERVLLLDNNHPDAEVKAAVHKLDIEGQPMETYWDVEGDQQYSIFEKWTHWIKLETP